MTVVPPKNLSPAKAVDIVLPSVTCAASTQLPTAMGLFRMHVFHQVGDEATDHVALSYGEIQGQSDVLIRMHSECLTAEVFHSLKCDCKAQLDAAMQAIAKEGHGLLIYLRQEGRGIGLVNKIKAYALQEQGYDTVDANRMLGLEDDLRTYDVAAAILHHFDIHSVRMLTNNPLKLESLDPFAIHVSQRVPLVCSTNPHNIGYFQAKAARMGHLYTPAALEPRNPLNHQSEPPLRKKD